MGIEIGGPYEIGGIKFEKTKCREWPYRVLSEHRHSWARKPRKCDGGTTIHNKCGVKVARLDKRGVTLFEGYAWNGSTGAKDILACMRASALHDAWCQAMKKGIYGNGYLNWRRGASEYRSICRADGMGWFRARARWLGSLVWGLKKLLPG